MILDFVVHLLAGASALLHGKTDTSLDKVRPGLFQTTEGVQSAKKKEKPDQLQKTLGKGGGDGGGLSPKGKLPSKQPGDLIYRGSGEKNPSEQNVSQASRDHSQIAETNRMPIPTDAYIPEQKRSGGAKYRQASSEISQPVQEHPSSFQAGGQSSGGRAYSSSQGGGVGGGGSSYEPASNDGIQSQKIPSTAVSAYPSSKATQTVQGSNVPGSTPLVTTHKSSQKVSSKPTVGNVLTDVSGNVRSSSQKVSSKPTAGNVLTDVSGNVRSSSQKVSSKPTVGNVLTDVSGNIRSSSQKASSKPTAGDALSDVSGNVGRSSKKASSQLGKENIRSTALSKNDVSSKEEIGLSKKDIAKRIALSDTVKPVSEKSVKDEVVPLAPPAPPPPPLIPPFRADQKKFGNGKREAKDGQEVEFDKSSYLAELQSVLDKRNKGAFPKNKEKAKSAVERPKRADLIKAKESDISKLKRIIAQKRRALTREKLVIKTAENEFEQYQKIKKIEGDLGDLNKQLVDNEAALKTLINLDKAAQRIAAKKAKDAELAGIDPARASEGELAAPAKSLGLAEKLLPLVSESSQTRILKDTELVKKLSSLTDEEANDLEKILTNQEDFVLRLSLMVKSIDSILDKREVKKLPIPELVEAPQDETGTIEATKITLKQKIDEVEQSIEDKKKIVEEKKQEAATSQATVDALQKELDDLNVKQLTGIDPDTGLHIDETSDAQRVALFQKVKAKKKELEERKKTAEQFFKTAQRVETNEDLLAFRFSIDLKEANLSLKRVEITEKNQSIALKQKRVGDLKQAYDQLAVELTRLEAYRDKLVERQKIRITMGDLETQVANLDKEIKAEENAVTTIKSDVETEVREIDLKVEEHAAAVEKQKKDEKEENLKAVRLKAKLESIKKVQNKKIDESGTLADRLARKAGDLKAVETKPAVGTEEEQKQVNRFKTLKVNPDRQQLPLHEEDDDDKWQ